MASQARNCIWRAQPGPQSSLIECPVFEVFYGGARGGGKTDGVLGDFARHAGDYGADAIGIMFRRERTQLIETIERSRAIYGPVNCQYHEQDKVWRFPNGARLRFGYLERDADADAWQGHSYSRVYVEEIGTFPSEGPVLKLMATLRSGAGVPVGFRATGNPGGPGHQWVKRRYIDPAPMGGRIIIDPVTGLKRIYIPSRLGDNIYLGQDYVQRLRASGGPQLVKAWLEGDWNAIEGAFFDCWSDRNVIRPFEIPREWIRFRSGDWGSASPFSIGWWAVVQDDHWIEGTQGANGTYLPRGALVRYREWYGSDDPASSSKGLKLTAEAVGDGIAKREKNDAKLAYGVMDPSAFKEDGGPSVMERLNGRLLAAGLAPFRAADNTRVASAGSRDRRGPMGGWDQMRARIIGQSGRPMAYWFSTCVASIRTIPVLQHDPDKAEDIDTESEDHCFVAGTLVATPTCPQTIDRINGGQVWNGSGRLTAYCNARLTRKNVEVVRLRFDDGSIVTCTPQHRFITTDGKWVCASNLLNETVCSYIIPECKNPSLSAPQFKNLTGFATFCAGSISSATVGDSIAKSGRRLTAQFPGALTFITRITTNLTTGQAILSALRPKIIAPIMPVFARASQRFLSPMRVRARQSGTDRQSGLNGIGNITRNIALRQCMAELIEFVSIAASRLKVLLHPIGFALMPANQLGVARPNLITLRAFASNAAPDLARIDLKRHPHAALNAQQLLRREKGPRCTNIDDAGRANVYCLTVPDGGSFLLANGMAVSNCADDARYAMSSRPWRRFIEPPDPARDAYRPPGDDMDGVASSVKLL